MCSPKRSLTPVRKNIRDNVQEETDRKILGQSEDGLANVPEHNGPSRKSIKKTRAKWRNEMQPIEGIRPSIAESLQDSSESR